MDLLDDNLSDFEIDDLDDTMQQLHLEEAIETCKKNLRSAEEGHKHSFLNRYLNHTES